MCSLRLGLSGINILDCDLASISCLWLEEMDPDPGRVSSFPLPGVRGGTWRRDDVPHMCGSSGQICKGHSCTLAHLIRCTSHMWLAATGCVKVQASLVGWHCRQEAIALFVDLRVAPHVCTETSPTVMWELVRMLPTVQLAEEANYPQSVGSVLPSDSCLGSASKWRPLSHTANRFWSMTAQCSYKLLCACRP